TEQGLGLVLGGRERGHAKSGLGRGGQAARRHGGGFAVRCHAAARLDGGGQARRAEQTGRRAVEIVDPGQRGVGEAMGAVGRGVAGGDDDGRVQPQVGGVVGFVFSRGG